MNIAGVTPRMRLLAVCITSTAACAAQSTTTSGSELAQRPLAPWTESTPEAQGMNSGDLADALEFARRNEINIHSLTVVRNGVIVLDAYFYPYTRAMRHDVASVTKSVMSLLVGQATSDGYLEGVNQRIVSALPTASTVGLDPQVAQIHVGDLLAMQSGFRCGLSPGERELSDMRTTNDWVAYALHLPMVAEPGTRFGYCSPNFHLLSAAIANATQRTTLNYARTRLFEPLGIDDVQWPMDRAGINHGWGDLQLRPRDMARIGQLMLQRGRWDERQIVPTAWIDSSLMARAMPNQNENYGFGWWLSRRVPTLFEAIGRGGQRISVVPAKNVVVVMTGGGFEPGDIGAFVLRSVRADTALREDTDGEARLSEALRLIAMSPLPRAVTQSSTASKVSRREYRLVDNRLGIRSFTIEFSDSAVAIMRVQLTDGSALVQRLGLDGVYRVSSGEHGTASAGRAEWLADGHLRIEFNTLARINRYIMDAEFSGDSVRIAVTEPTEVGSVTLRGEASR